MSIEPLKRGTVLRGGRAGTSDLRIEGVRREGLFGIDYAASRMSGDETVLLRELAFAPIVRREPQGGSVAVRRKHQELHRRMVSRQARDLERYRVAGSPHLLSVLDVWTERGTIYAAVESPRGGAVPASLLSELLGPSGAGVSAAECTAIAKQLLDALEPLHGASIGHGSVRPDAIYVHRDGQGVVTRLGLPTGYEWVDGVEALRTDTGVDRVFPAPELERAILTKFGPWADLYSWARTVAEAAEWGGPEQTESAVAASSGLASEETVAALADRLEGRGLDPQLARMVTARLAPNLAERPRDLREVRSGLRTARSARATSGAPEDRPGPRPGEIIDDRYEIDELIASGGMGDVYRARHVRTGGEVAVKLMNASSRAQASLAERFGREARACARLRHSSNIRVLDFGSWRDDLYLVMELLEGIDLKAVLRRNGPLTEERICDLIIPACAALAEAHELGMVHRDLKPSNLFLHEAAGERVVKVLDYGLVKMIRETTLEGAVTPDGRVLGTPYYVSPEQVRSAAIDSRTDIYSLGVIMYELATGRPPFLGRDASAVMLQHVRKRPPPMEQRAQGEPPSEAFEEIVARCLRKDASERFQQTADLAAALVEHRRQRQAEPGSGPQPTAPPPGRPEPAPGDAASRGVGDLRTWIVGPGSGTDESSIARAVAQASDGATVLVQPGTYSETVVVERDVTIAADGGEVTLSAVEAPCVIVRAGGPSFRGLTLRCEAGSKQELSPGVHVLGGRPDFENCTFVGGSGPAVQVEGGETRATIRASQCERSNHGALRFLGGSGGLVEGFVATGPGLAAVSVSESTDLIIRSSVFDGWDQGVLAFGGAAPVIDACEFRNHNFEAVVVRGASPTLIGSRIVDGDDCAIFVEGSDARLTLKQSELQRNAGGGLVLQDRADATIKSSSITANGRSGLSVASRASLFLESTQLAENAEAGLWIAGLGRAQIASCRFVRGRGAGLIVDGGSAELDGCTFEDNALQAIRCRQRASIRMTGGNIGGSGDDGVVVMNAHSVELSDVEIEGVAGAGIRIDGATSVTLREVTVCHSRGDGVVLSSVAKAELIEVRSMDNDGAGLRVDDSVEGMRAGIVSRGNRDDDVIAETLVEHERPEPVTGDEAEARGSVDSGSGRH